LDLYVLHNFTNDLTVTLSPLPLYIHTLRGSRSVYALGQNPHKKLPRLFAEARQRECL